jgi:hypothetical protein
MGPQFTHSFVFEGRLGAERLLLILGDGCKDFWHVVGEPRSAMVLNVERLQEQRVALPSLVSLKPYLALDEGTVVSVRGDLANRGSVNIDVDQSYSYVSIARPMHDMGSEQRQQWMKAHWQSMKRFDPLMQLCGEELDASHDIVEMIVADNERVAAIPLLESAMLAARAIAGLAAPSCERLGDDLVLKVHPVRGGGSAIQ